MIVDRIKNKGFYKDNIFYKYLEMIANINWYKEEGKTLLDGDNYYSIDSLETKEIKDGIWESHKKYVDIQYIISGRELIGYEDVAKLEELRPYDKEKDLVFYKGEVKNGIIMEEGMFMILHQQDAHMTKLAPNNIKQDLKKVIFKIQSFQCY